MTTTKPPNAVTPQSTGRNLPSLPSPPATPQDIIVELSRLSVVMAHQSALTKEEQAVRFLTMCEDLKGKTLEEIRDGCRRYRTNPKNTFFPSPGQLLEACRNPFDTPGPKRHYEPLPELPSIGACVTPERMRADIQALGLGERSEPSIEERKAAILARPPTQWPKDEMSPERKNRLLRSLKRALEFKYGFDAQRYIAELPTHGPE